MLQDPNVERYIEIAVKPLKKEIEQMKAQIEVLNQALRIHDVSGSINVPPTRVRFWKNIHDDTTVEHGSVIDQTESHYIVIPDDDVRPTVKWLKSKCDVLR